MTPPRNGSSRSEGSSKVDPTCAFLIPKEGFLQAMNGQVYGIGEVHAESNERDGSELLANENTFEHSEVPCRWHGIADPARVPVLCGAR